MVLTLVSYAHDSSNMWFADLPFTLHPTRQRSMCKLHKYKVMLWVWYSLLCGNSSGVNLLGSVIYTIPPPPQSCFPPPLQELNDSSRASSFSPSPSLPYLVIARITSYCRYLRPAFPWHGIGPHLPGFEDIWRHTCIHASSVSWDGCDCGTWMALHEIILV